MKITRANVMVYAAAKGYEPVQIDGIPEGFSFKEPDIEIGGKVHEGQYVAFVPLKDWAEEMHRLTAESASALLTAYNSIKK